jgi:ATP-binding cassette, subfamily C (CFTR/MRP), member 1
VRSGIIASKYFHNTLLVKILKFTLTFFSETPSGRILNRLTQDIDKIDRVLSTSVRDFVMSWISVSYGMKN